jgi:hypothetical protein
MFQAKAWLTMSFTRVERDGVEFYTLKSNGASGMSIAALARLCGVGRNSIHALLKAIHDNKTRSEWLKGFIGKPLYLTINEPGHAKIIRADVCFAIICYYAFESDREPEEAKYAFGKFGPMGIEGWIHEITGWKAPAIAPEPTREAIEKYINDQLPENCVASAVEVDGVIEIIQKSGFSATGLRIYFYLEMRMLKGEQPDLNQICQDLNIASSTFKKWLPKIQAWSGVAKWLELPSRRGPERQIQLRLQKELGGDMEAYTPIGPIDLVTKTEIIEIKRVEDWKTALGQVIAKAQSFPKHTKRIHLFGESSKQLKKITNHCQILDVMVTFEKVVLESEMVAA